MAQPDEAEINARLQEIDHLIEELQKRKHELLETKEGVRLEMGSQNSSGPPSAEATGAKLPVLEKAETALEEVLNSLPWKSFKKKEGQWTFLRDRDGSLIDELAPVKEFVDRVRKQQAVVVGKYSYRVSEDRFLNRFLVGN